MKKYAELSEEYAEMGVDKVIEEASKYLPALQSISEEIPIVKTAVAAITIPKTITDAILANKVETFLYGSNLTEEKIEKLKKSFSREKQEKLWKTVFHSINSHDNEKKSEIVGKLFSALIDGFIDETEFMGMTHATNTLDVSSLDNLKAIYYLNPVIELPTNTLINFSILGLLNADNSTVGLMNGGGPEYPPNNFGWRYVGIVNDFPKSGIPNVKIGEGILYEEIDKNGMITGSSWPIEYMIDEGLIYREVIGIAIDNTNKTLIDIESGLPYIFESHPVTPELKSYMIASNHFRNMSKKGPAELFHRVEGSREVNAFVFEIKSIVPGTKFELTQIVEKTISELKGDKISFYSEIINKIRSFQDEDGENHEDWLYAYD